jgi:hypothetical protein
MRNTRNIGIVAGLLALLVIAGCASRVMVEKVGGEQKMGERLSVQIDGPWNRISAPNMGPAQIWTMEGLAVDQLLLYPGLKDGEAIHAVARNSRFKSFLFRSVMQPDEIVSLFEGMLTRDGSRFTLVKLEPSNFATGKGFRFEFELVRRVNNLRVSGVGYGAVSKGELFSMLYVAPRMTFYPRHIAQVEKISATARIQE